MVFEGYGESLFCQLCTAQALHWLSADLRTGVFRTACRKSTLVRIAAAHSSLTSITKLQGRAEGGRQGQTKLRALKQLPCFPLYKSGTRDTCGVHGDRGERRVSWRLCGRRSLPQPVGLAELEDAIPEDAAAEARCERTASLRTARSCLSHRYRGAQRSSVSVSKLSFETNAFFNDGCCGSAADRARGLARPRPRGQPRGDVHWHGPGRASTQQPAQVLAAGLVSSPGYYGVGCGRTLIWTPLSSSRTN